MDFANISRVLNTTFQEPLSDLVARSNPTLSALTKRAVASQEIYIKTAMSSDHEAEAIADGSAVTVTDPTTDLVGGRLPWATYISKFKVPKRLLEQVSSNPGALGNLFKFEVEQAAKDLADKIAADLWGGVATNGLVGMQAVIDDSNTYANINRALAANENWRAVVYDAATGGATTELSTELLYELDSLFFNRNRYGFIEQPQRFMGVTDAAFMKKYLSILENINISATDGTTAANIVARQSGAQSNGQIANYQGTIGFMGIPFMRNANVKIDDANDLAGSTRLYMLDPSQWFIATLNPNSADAQIHQYNGAQSAPVVDGIRTQIEILGNSGEFVAGYVKSYLQLVCVDPAKGGTVIKNIAAV